MVSWNIALGLMILCFFLPLALLYARISRLVERMRQANVERRQLRAMLQDVESHLYRDKSLFLEALGVPFLLLRRSGRVEMGNAAAAQLLGVNITLHTHLLRYLEAGPLRDAIAQATKCTAFQHIDVPVEQGGEKRHYRASVTPLQNDERLIGMVFHDLTEIRRTQMIRREFVANASHELRTPLTIIRGYLETLIEDEELAHDDEARVRVLGLMKNHADRIVRLVKDMLTLSRMEDADHSYMRQEAFDLNLVAQEVYERLVNQMTAQKAEIVIEIEPKPFMMHGDSFYWAQILYNLMENSLKNNPTPGLKVHLTARMSTEGESQICVQDNGVGIPEEAIPFIFNRFYRANTSPQIKGTGLGLAIVRHAVEIHHGSIAVESIPQQRTAFTITLPPWSD